MYRVLGIQSCSLKVQRHCKSLETLSILLILTWILEESQHVASWSTSVMANYWSCVNRSYRIQPDPSTPLPSIIFINIEEILVEDFRMLKKIPSREPKTSPTFSWKGKKSSSIKRISYFSGRLIIFGFSMISIGTSRHSCKPPDVTPAIVVI